MLRRFSLIAGFVLAVFALFADLFGISGSGFSTGQVLILFTSALLIAAGFLGKSFFKYYKNTATLLLNIFIVMIVVELSALVVIRIWQHDQIAVNIRKNEAELLEESEFGRMTFGRYIPFLVWRADPDGYITELVDANGYRLTPGSEESADSYKVFVFGGSTVWGSCVSDSCTIPSYLLQMINMRTSLPVEVRNYGQLGYVTTQDVLELMFQIRDGNIPDLAIFIDGMNDVSSGYQSGIAGTHQNYSRIRDRIEQRGNTEEAVQGEIDPFLSHLLWKNTFNLISLLKEQNGSSEWSPEIINYASMGVDTVQLASEISELCLKNYTLAAGLADQWDFHVVFFWQPSIWTGNKILTEQELPLQTGGGDPALIGSDPAWVRLAILSHGFFESESANFDNVYDLSGIFDSLEETVYVDLTGVHLTPRGNWIIATEVISRVCDLGALDHLQNDTFSETDDESSQEF